MVLLRKALCILTPAQRWACAGYFALAVTSSLVELFGIGLVVLLLQSLATDRPSGLIARLEPLVHVFSFGTRYDAQINLIVFLVGAYLVRLLVTLAYSDVRIRLITSVQHSAMRRIYRGVMSMPYASYGLIEPSAVLTALWKVTPRVSRNLLSAVLVVMVEAILAASVVLAMALQEPVTTLAIGVSMALVYGLVQALTHRRLRANGAAETKTAQQYQKLVLDSFRGFREVRIYGIGRLMDQRHEALLDHELALQREARLLGEVPRPVIETAVVFVVLGVVLAQLLLDVPKAEFASRMLVLAVCVARLMPSANRLSVAWSGISHNLSSIDELLDIVRRYPERQASAHAASALPSGATMVIEHVGFAYPEGGPVLQDVSLQIQHGAMVGFVGGSGSGKTTLLEIIAGLLAPTTGRVVVGGEALTESHAAAWLSRIGYVPQSTTLIGGSIRENVAFGRPDDAQRLEAAVAAAQLGGLVGRLPAGLDTQVGEAGDLLSGGERQRIGLARALYGSPEVLILDEATSALDVNTEAAVLDVLDGLRGAVTIIVVAHRLSAVARCDAVHWLEAGRLAKSGAYADVVTSMTAARAQTPAEVE